MLLVTGSPGAGKSALLSGFVERMAARGVTVPHHFMRRGAYDWDAPYAVQSSLVAQIEALYPQMVNADARPERRLVELLLRISNKLLIPEQRRLILVIDGLNEALADGSENPLPRFLPHALPPGVFVLSSIRAGHPYLSFFGERADRWLRTLDLDRAIDSRHGATQAFWAHHGPRLGLPPEFVQAAVRAADGSPLHAALLRQQLAVLPPAERSEYASAPLPYNLWGLLEALTAPLAEADGPGTQARPEQAAARELLGLLCAVRAAVPLRLLSRVLGAVRYTPPAAALAAPFVLTEQTPLGPGLRMAHDCFRELVQTRIGPQELRRHARRLVQMLAAWPPDAAEPADTTGAEAAFRRAYALRYGVLHRIDAGDWAAVEQLLGDVAYLIAKCREAGTLPLEHDFAVASARCPDPVRQKEWRDLQRAVREETHWLRRDPASLPTRLYNRLRRMGWPGARIGRALSMPQGVAQLRLQRGIGGHERTFTGHASSVYGCAATRDGKRLVTASWDKTLRVWDLSTGHVLHTLKGHTAEVTACAVLPDGQRVVSSSADNTLKVWELSSGRELLNLAGHGGEVTACAVFPDGKHALSGARDKTLKLWDLATGKAVQTLKGHLSWVTACAVLEDGERVLSGSWDKTLKLWDAASGREIATLSGHTAGVRAVAVLPDGHRAVSGSEDHTLKLWDLRAGTELVTFQGHTSGVTGCAILPDGRRMVSTAKDKTLKVWDLNSGQVLATLHGHSAWVTACVALPGGRHVASGSDDYSVKIWDLTAGHELSTLHGHSAAVSSCAGVPADASGRADSELREAAQAALSADGEWPAIEEIEDRSGSWSESLVQSQAGTGNRLLTGSADRTLKVWDLAAGKAVQTLKGHTDLVTSCAVSPDGRRAVSGSWDKTLRVWDLSTGTLRRTLTGHTWFVTACVLIDGGRRAVSGSWDKTLRVWDLESGAEILALRGHTAQVTCAAVLPGGTRLLSGSRDSTLRVWDLSSGQELRALRGHIDFVTTCVALPDGLHALSGSEDRSLKLWDLQTGEEKLVLSGHAAAVSACAVTPDGLCAISGSEDHTLKVWDLASGRCLDTVYGVAPFDCVAAFAGRICAGDRVGNVWLLSATADGIEAETLAGEPEPVPPVPPPVTVPPPAAGVPRSSPPPSRPPPGAPGSDEPTRPPR